MTVFVAFRQHGGAAGLNRNPYLNQIAGALLLSIVLLSASMGVSWADDGSFSSKISGSIVVEFQNDFAFSSDDETEEFNNLFTKIEPGLTLTLTDQLSVNAGLVLEPVQDPTVKVGLRNSAGGCTENK